MKKRKTKLILVSLIAVSIFGYLMYSGLRDTMTYYLTVPEVLAGTTQVASETIRVGGNVFPESVRWDPKTLQLYFKIGEGETSLNVDYKGVVPDSFKPGREVIIEGTYDGKGKILASTIMPKCASKYE